MSFDRESVHQELWGGGVPVVGMVHLLPLPGSPRWCGSMDEVLTRASEEAALLGEEGLDGVLVENFGDAPFFPERVPPETVAAMAVAVREVVRCTSLPVGVNLLRNDAHAALAVAVAAGARFIRVNVHTGSMFTDQGLLQGQAHRTLRMRRNLGVPLSLLADVMVKHATPPPGATLEAVARDSWFRGMADGLILTGSETGAAVDLGVIQQLREALPVDAKVWVGSGASPESAPALIQAADGIIVGSALQSGGSAGAGIDRTRVRAFMNALNRG
ncbi:MAG: BtpA/SgcQ family protein [Longimicrobiales bacterium]|nr:BtpA/SgcQ family protein [Longimicrobiales bacterium]